MPATTWPSTSASAGNGSSAVNLDSAATHQDEGIRTRELREEVKVATVDTSWSRFGFGIIERRSIRRGSHASVKDLHAQIRAFIEGWNDRWQPFSWTETADDILNKVNRHSALGTLR